MSQALIRRAFEAVLKTWADGQSPAVPVVWQNVEATQPAPTQRYVRAFVLPLPTLSEDIERTHRRYEGRFQVTLCEPLGAGAGAAETVVAALIALYPPATVITVGSLRVYVLQPLSPAPALSERDRFVIPCSLPYRADTYPP